MLVAMDIGYYFKITVSATTTSLYVVHCPITQLQDSRRTADKIILLQLAQDFIVSL